MTEDRVPFALPDITDAEIEAVTRAMRSGWVTSGPEMVAFEHEFVAHVGGQVEAVAVNSATAGLHLALEACGIGPGDEVIVPTWTFTATAEVVRYLGATPVLVDVHPITLNIDMQAVAESVTPATRAAKSVGSYGIKTKSAVSPLSPKRQCALSANKTIAVMPTPPLAVQPVHAGLMSRG